MNGSDKSDNDVGKEQPFDQAERLKPVVSHLPLELARRLTRVARRENRTVSGQIRHYLSGIRELAAEASES